MTAALLTEGDLDRQRPLDLAAQAPQRRDGSKELQPDFCRHGHRSRFQQGWDPGRGRVYYCVEPGCRSEQARY